jgi:hypothetical protein
MLQLAIGGVRCVCVHWLWALNCSMVCLLAGLVELVWSTEKKTLSCKCSLLVKPEFTVAQWAIFLLKLKRISSLFFLSTVPVSPSLCKSEGDPMHILCSANMFSWLLHKPTTLATANSLHSPTALEFSYCKCVATSLKLEQSSHGHGCCRSCCHRLSCFPPSSPRPRIEAVEPPFPLPRQQQFRTRVLSPVVPVRRPRRAPLLRCSRRGVVPKSRGLLPAPRGLHLGLLRDGLPLRVRGLGPRRREGGRARPRRGGAGRGRDAGGVRRRGRERVWERLRRDAGGLLLAEVGEARPRRGRRGGRARRPDPGARARARRRSGGGARVAAGGPARRGRVGQLLRPVVHVEPLPARRVRRLMASERWQPAWLAGQPSPSSG